jgi:basic membrane lipoprotein Med (substrate-binding protein (PBP1-ABC) superfamily)
MELIGTGKKSETMKKFILKDNKVFEEMTQITEKEISTNEIKEQIDQIEAAITSAIPPISLKTINNSLLLALIGQSVQTMGERLDDLEKRIDQLGKKK